ncbi:hypothetical protein EWM64_g1181 [Hericium alpestre]|uniref:PWWP domain-containing protein n=1 Tax=Hericium alpestre TaxID=135208 RepID=A0A4Z0AB83_9AGAM|nr:hypothetical protein EWM64_g1181 [Hericium alpestre]
MNKKSKAGKDTKYEYRDVVLAKARGYPPWSSMVIDPDTVPGHVAWERLQNKKSNFYCVRFFPRGEHAWPVSKIISKLQMHEIEAYIKEPYKRSGELLTDYRITLDPSKWEEQMESEHAEAAGEEANEGREAAQKAGAKPKAKGKAKKEPAEPASKKKAPVSAGGKKNGVKSKAMVEYEDDDGDAEGDENAGPSKQALPPVVKKAKREKNEDQKISGDEEFQFRDRARVLIKKWQAILNAAKGTEAPLEDTKISESPEKELPEATTTDDRKMKAAPLTAEPETNGTTIDNLLADADTVSTPRRSCTTVTQLQGLYANPRGNEHRRKGNKHGQGQHCSCGKRIAWRGWGRDPWHGREGVQ